MKKPKLVPEWKRVARYSWSIRLAVTSSVLSAIQFGLPFVAPDRPSGKFAAAAMVVSLLAGVARVVEQKQLSGNR